MGETSKFLPAISTFMPNRKQLSAGEGFDDLTGQRLGEGFEMLRTSGGSRLCFRSPAEAWFYRNSPAKRAQMRHSSYNTTKQVPGA